MDRKVLRQRGPASLLEDLRVGLKQGGGLLLHCCGLQWGGFVLVACVRSSRAEVCAKGDGEEQEHLPEWP